MSGTVYELQDKQRLAVDPLGSVWLSASAGTGKTQVLSARVLRLLLEPGADPAQVLCLTFTKAGAAEMAVRVNAVLARWVRLKSTDLARELGYLGAHIDPETQARARSLFASLARRMRFCDVGERQRRCPRRCRTRRSDGMRGTTLVLCGGRQGQHPHAGHNPPASAAGSRWRTGWTRIVSSWVSAAAPSHCRSIYPFRTALSQDDTAAIVISGESR